MMYFQLAWRYATRRLVNYIAVAALALALMVQIVAMAVLDGMLVDLERRLRNLGQQVTLRVAPAPNRQDFAKVSENIVSTVKGVKAVTPLMRKVGLIDSGRGDAYAFVQGIDLKAELAHSALASHLLSYKPDPADPSWYPPASAKQDRPGMFVGEQLANELGVSAGDEVDLFFAERDEENNMRTRSRRFVVTSLYRSGVYEYDNYGVYAPLESVAGFYLESEYPDAPERVETLVLWLDDPEQADALAPEAEAAVKSALPAAAVVSNTWKKRWADMAEGMKHENNLMELVLFLNDAASGFCVFAILVTLVSRRIRDVGLMRCIGASRRGVMCVFLIVGLLIGLCGGILGVAGGAFLAGPLTLEKVNGQWRLAAGGAVDKPLGPTERPEERRPRLDRYYESVTGSPLYPPRMFGVSGKEGLAVVMYVWKLVIYFAAAVLVAVLAALYPAVWAAWREPMSALREG